VKVKTGSGAAPPPIDLDSLLKVDEGPMRGDLRRQIALLERELARIKAIVEPWDGTRMTPLRGPALLPSESLEKIRDELLNAVRRIHARFVDDGR
jgi:hypothetical protein